MKLTDPKGYTIQPAKAPDIPLLNAIEAAASVIFPSGFLPKNILAERVPSDVFMDTITQGRLLATLDTDYIPVGYAFWQTVDGSALLAQMNIHPQHGRKKLGTVLVTQIIEQVAEAGFPHIYLTIFSDVP